MVHGNNQDGKLSLHVSFFWKDFLKDLTKSLLLKKITLNFFEIKY